MPKKQQQRKQHVRCASTNSYEKMRPAEPWASAEFKPFEWIEAHGLDPAQHHLAALLNDSRDVVQGAQTLIQLLDWDEDRRDSAVTPEDPAPLLSANHRASLLRLLSASLGLLHARIESQCEGGAN